MRKRFLLFGVTMVMLLVLAACGASNTPTPTKAIPPTWTPTPMSAAQAVPATPTTMAVAATPTAAPATPVPPTPIPEPTDTPLPPTATPIPPAIVQVTSATANLRSGPGVVYDRTGAVRNGDQFVILARNTAGDWWQIQVNGEAHWIYGDLVQATNADSVPIATNIPPTPIRPTATPVPPTATPAPSTPDPCATIGGDGCKFKMRGGPAFAPDPYELKLTLAFVHGGRNDEAQGSYFVWLEKDGVKLPVSDKVRSWTGPKRSGANGAYNYEYSIGIDQLPGNTVAGNYTIWVLDGNGERDSQTFQFSVPEGQGEVWIKFDQN